MKVAIDMVNGAVTSKYLRGIGLIAMEQGATREYYLYNAHGDVTARTNARGNITQKYDYDAFGNQREVAGYAIENDSNPFRCCGEYFDTETGTIYLRNRYYNPSNGRFTREDPIRDGLNWYTYDNNEEKVLIMAKELEELYGSKVHIRAIENGTQFKDYWNDMIGFDADGNEVTIDATVLLFHGWGGGIGFHEKKNGKIDFSQDDILSGGRNDLAGSVN